MKKNSRSSQKRKAGKSRKRKSTKIKNKNLNKKNAMKKPENINIDMDMANVGMSRGTLSDISSGNDEEYITHIILALPVDKGEFIEGSFKVSYQEKEIEVAIKKVTQREEDLLLNMANKIMGKDFQFGFGSELLPLEIFTDHRGIYPVYLAEIVFDFRVSSWLDPNHPAKLKFEDTEETQILGIPALRDKVEAIKILNRLFKSNGYSLSIKNITYEDITVFIQAYKKKSSPDKKFIVGRSTFLASKDAYKNAIYDYYLGPNRPEVLTNLATNGLVTLTPDHRIESKPPINNEEDLVNIINKVIDSVIKHHVENRHWIEAFWDGKRKIIHDGKTISVPTHPKKERDIQPTLHVLLFQALHDLGIHVERETDEGVGSLDFKCLYTTPGGNPICICIEFKLAHNKEIEKGIKKQLPAYLRANSSTRGIFPVMWFKDDKKEFFKEPNGNKSELYEVLKNLSEEVKKESGQIISVSMIDASIRPSASK